MRRPRIVASRSAMTTASATVSSTSTSEKPSLIWIAPTTLPANVGLVGDGPDQVAGSQTGSSTATDEQPNPGTARTVATGRLRAVGRPRGGPTLGAARERGIGRAGRGGGPALSGGDASSTSSPSAAAGSLDQRNRGQCDVDQVELLGQRLHDPAEPVIAVCQQGLAQVRPHDLGAALAQVGDRGQPGDLELRARGRLDVAQHPVLARLDQGDRRAFAAGSPGPPDAMHVRIGVRRDVEVDDVRDVIDVESAGGHVRRHEDVERPVPEAAHDPVAALLGQPAMERAGIVSAGAQRLGQVVHLASRAGEDERRRRVLDVEDPAQRRELVGTTDDVGDLADERNAVRRGRFGVDLDPRGVLQVSLRDAGDGRRDRGREERGLALGGRRAAGSISRSSAKPMSSISSASSRITTLTASNLRLPRLR